ncbi:MAG: hypothetical protein ACR65R_13645 [Methylomicrobium sp.]
MNPLTKTITALLLLSPLGIGAYAAEEPAQNPKEHSMPGMNHESGRMQGMKMQGGMQGMNMPSGQCDMQGMGCMGMMGEMNNEQTEQHMRMMQEHMLQMQDLSNKILAATDPVEKEKLKKQQLDLMKAHRQQMMQMMHGGMSQKDVAGKKKSPAQQ